jgi:fructose-bisphosphate aldolase class I
MALYAGFCQAANIVPMIEPEVMLDGDHDIQRAEEVTTRTLEICFDALREYHVDLKGLILKSSMVIPGNKCPAQSSPEQIAEATIRCLKKTVPAEVPGIVFLSGGQTAEQATENLRAINQVGKKLNAPWQLTFSYARALQGPPLAAWAGKPENLPKAREIFTERLTANSKARMGL